MKTSEKGINFIKSYEGFKSKPYLCPADKPTIGYGSTYYEDGKPVTLKDNPITEVQASNLLLNTLKPYEDTINKSVTAQLTQDQFDALVSFTYNLGVSSLTSSTLLKKININPSDTTIKDEFTKWVNIRVKGKLIRSAGLMSRRLAEAKLYFNE